MNSSRDLSVNVIIYHQSNDSVKVFEVSRANTTEFRIPQQFIFSSTQIREHFHLQTASLNVRQSDNDGSNNANLGNQNNAILDDVTR